MSVDSIELWHKRARPNPTDKDFNVQLGCHFEEIAEQVRELTFVTDTHSPLPGEKTMLHAALVMFADMLKTGETSALIKDRKEFLDSLADQIVTATGVGHCAGMKTAEACVRVNSSNWSKYDVNGQPLFDANGKITKGPNYHKPDLEGLY